MHVVNDSGSETRAPPTIQTTQKVTIFFFLSFPFLLYKIELEHKALLPKLHEGLFSVLPGMGRRQCVTRGARALIPHVQQILRAKGQSEPLRLHAMWSLSQ